MPTIAENKKYWDGEYSWEQRGDEWSRDWGSVTMQWYGTLLPRIHAFLPADTILEVGCGYGRWTQFLKNYCSHLIAVDLSNECVAACRERFKDSPHVSCHRNDGTSLAMISNSSVDFIFSFDALPLVDDPTIDDYLAQLARVLTDNGVAFLHHSNLGAYPLHERLSKLQKLAGVLRFFGLLEKNVYWRDTSVSAEGVVWMAAAHGLSCASQELIRWGTRRLFVDSFSVLENSSLASRREFPRLKNKQFDREAENLARLGRLYVR